MDEVYLRHIVGDRLRTQAKAKPAPAAPAKKQAIALPRLPATSEVNEAEFRKVWGGAGEEKWREVLPSLTFEQIRDDFFGRENEMRKLWNEVAGEITNPFTALREFLICHDATIERDRLVARELRVRLEARVAALENNTNNLKYVGVFREGSVYHEGNFATSDGSIWHANESTMERPGSSKSWTLACKKGRDGSRSPRDGGG